MHRRYVHSCASLWDEIQVSLLTLRKTTKRSVLAWPYQLGSVVFVLIMIYLVPIVVYGRHPHT